MIITLRCAGPFWYVTLENTELAAKNGVVQPIEFYNFSAGGFVKNANQCSKFRSLRLAESIWHRLCVEQEQAL